MPFALTIPQRLAAATALASSTSLFLAVATLAILDERQARADLLSRRQTDAEMISLHVTSALLFDDPASAESTLRVLRLKPDIERACIYGREGRLFAEYSSRGPGCSPSVGGGEAPGVDRDRVRVVRPVEVGQERTGTIVIQSHLQELVQRSRRILWSGGLVSIVAFGVGVAISWRHQRVLSRPLEALTRTAREVSTGQDDSQRVDATAPGEMGVLISTFNGMLDRIQDRDRLLHVAKSELEERVAERTEELRRQLVVREQAEAEVRRLNEAMAQRVEEVTALNREIESFSYSVSHDLRAPLRHIHGFVDLLRERAGGALDEKSKHYLQVIAGGASRMGCLIDDLLSFSRMSRTEMEQAEVRLLDLVQDVRQEAEREAGGRGIEWVVGPLPPVRGDRALLRVAFLNLVSNAVKYSARTAHARIEVGCRPSDNGLVVVFVSDNGVGFDMKYAGKLFGVFQRLHRPEEFEGTGIGLATVRRIVNRHGGEVWVEAEPDRGATFFVSLVRGEGA